VAANGNRVGMPLAGRVVQQGIIDYEFPWFTQPAGLTKKKTPRQARGLFARRLWGV